MAVHSCHVLDTAAYTDLVATACRTLADLVRDADATLPVPTCPGWTIAAAVEHTGSIHRWAARMVAESSAQRLGREAIDFGFPDDPTGYAAWLEAGAAQMQAAFAACDPDTPMWAWGADKHARFWPRRMLHETTIHAADIALARRLDPVIAAEVAVDGIDELLENLPHAAYFAPNVAKLQGAGRVIGLHPTDVPETWRITLRDDGFVWDHGSADADVQVAGTAADLYLLLWGRRSPDDERYTVGGEPAVLGDWLANSAL